MKDLIITTEVAEKFVTAPESKQFDKAGRNDAINLYNTFKLNGWKDYESHSQNGKASFEAHVKKNEIRVDIIATNFMGYFVDVRVYK